MSLVACTRARARIDARDELSDAERLELEEHLAGCGDCRGYARLIDEARALLASDALPSLSARARARAIGRALSQDGAPHRSDIAERRGIVLAVAAAMVGALVVVLSFHAASGSGDRELLRAEASRAHKRDALLPNRPTHVEAGARLRVAHAELRVEEPSILTWDPRRRVLGVDRGVVEVDVDPRPRRRLEVVRARYSVQVLGTCFVVREDGVDVSRGAVRILGHDGRVLVDRLAAGQSWLADAEREPRTDAAIVPPEAPAAVPPAPQPIASVRAQLRRARMLLADRRADEARAQIDAALRSSPTRPEQAEARTLRAEHALVVGGRERAIALYLEVGRGYRDLAAGDNALYAAARLRARAGPASEARDLFAEYVATYPRGRFRREAARRLSGGGAEAP